MNKTSGCAVEFETTLGRIMTRQQDDCAALSLWSLLGTN